MKEIKKAIDQAKFETKTLLAEILDQPPDVNGYFFMKSELLHLLSLVAERD